MTADLPIGRGREVAELGAFLTQPNPGARGHVLVGEAGIGKTALWTSAVETARAVAPTVLVARLAEPEHELSFAGLTDLFGPLADRLSPLLPPPQRRALEIALLLREADDDATDPRAIGSATRTCLEQLARSGPVVLAIDDLQWLDGPSTDALVFALRRSHDLALRILATVRTAPGDGVADLRHPVLDALPPGSSVVRQVTGLSLGAMGHLLRARLGAPVARAALIRLHEASQGNPFFALELASASIDRNGEVGTLELPVLSSELSRVVGDRIDRLPVATQRLLVLVAAAAQPTLADVRAATGLDAGRDLEPASRAGIVAIEGSRLRFTHPLYAAAAYGRVAPKERAAAHRALARHAPDPVQLARHQALGTRGRSARAAAIVERGADVATQRGAPSIGAELMAQARRLTPAVRTADGWRRAVAEAGLRWEIGEPAAARSLLEVALPHLPRGRDHAEAAILLAVIVEWYDGAAAAARVLRDVLRSGPIEPDLEAALRLRLAIIRDNATISARQASIAAARLGPDVGSFRDLRACALLIRADACLRLGRGNSIEDIRSAERLLDKHRGHPPSVPMFAAAEIAEERAWILESMTGDLATARTSAIAIVERLHQLGWERAQGVWLAELSIVESWMGVLDAAEAHANASMDLADQTGDAAYARAESLMALALAAASRGALVEGRRWVVESLAARPLDGSSGLAARTLAVLGFLELSDDRPREAFVALERVAAIVRAAGDRDPADVRYEGDHLEAALMTGNAGTADRILADLEARRQVADRPWLRVMIGRGRALIASAGGDATGALDELDAAIEAHAALEMPLERGRTLLLEGRLRRKLREKRSARDAFEAAHGLFVAAGASRLADTATAELARVGLRPPSPNVLTESERSVARLAARGRTNREVGQELFLSPKSVDGVLNRVYQKLGIHSRAELGARLAPDATDPGENPQ